MSLVYDPEARATQLRVRKYNTMRGMQRLIDKHGLAVVQQAVGLLRNPEVGYMEVAVLLGCTKQAIQQMAAHFGDLYPMPGVPNRTSIRRLFILKQECVPLVYPKIADQLNARSFDPRLGLRFDAVKGWVRYTQKAKV